MEYGKWVKAEASNGSVDNCVEVQHTPAETLVRDSKDPEGPVLRFTPAEWAAFTDGMQKHEFTR